VYNKRAMPKEVKVLELSPEQIQQFLSERQIAEEFNEKQLENEESALEQAILVMTPSEISDYLAEHLAHTDVVVTATNIVSDFNFHDAILIAAINRSRNGLDAAIAWIENQFSLNEEQAKNDPTKNKTESPKPQKEGKRVVYGTGVNSRPEDDSEQL